jgi:predicted nucleotidyltransferase
MSIVHVPQLEARIAAEFRQRLSDLGPRVKRIRLFGSRVRGTSRPESDLDVLVLLDVFDRPTRNMILDHAFDVSYENDFVIRLAPLVMGEAEFQRLLSRERRLALDIEREGVDVDG